MDSGWRWRWTSLAAGSLVFLTLYVFYRLQDYGPESAIRRFHADVMANDLADLQRVTKRSIDSNSAIWLRARVQEWLSKGGSYQLLQMDRAPFAVRAAVVYTEPNGVERPLIWVVRKSGRSWMVDTDGTVNIVNDVLGLLRRGGGL